MANTTKLLCSLLFFSFLLVGCGDSQEAKQNEANNKVLRVGLTADYPPFEFIQDKDIKGFDIDLANVIAKELSKDISIKDMDFDSLIPALNTGRIDCAISGMTVTEERRQNIDFSVSYYTPQFAMLYRRDEPIKDVADLNDSIIGAQLGTSMETYLKERTEEAQNLNIIALKRNQVLIQELTLSRLDGVLVEEAQAKAFVKSHPELDYSLFSARDMGVAVALAKHSPLKAKIDAIIIKLRDSGELDIIKAKWLGDK